MIGVEHLWLPADVEPALPSTTDLGAMECHTIARVMRETNWNKARAANRLGVTRTQLYVRLRKYGLMPGGQPKPSKATADGAADLHVGRPFR
jgi:DNA-binding NtrC family response regulator